MYTSLPEPSLPSPVRTSTERKSDRQIRDYALEGQVAVNLSPRQFTDPTLIERICHITQTQGIDPAKIVLEVTESCLIDDTEAAIDILRTLRAAGFSISLDDFGTGYSSLALLKQLPVDKLKIDRSFIRDLDNDDRKIVQAIIKLAHTLGMQVIAEGIEENAQLILLQQMRCDFGQGYLFSRPKPVTELLKASCA